MVSNILKIAVPSMIALFFQQLAEIINTYYVGHLNDAAMLAGAGMGNIIINMLCMSIILGMNGALETLISQANGANNLELCTVYLNRGRTIMFITFIPITIILLHTDKIMVSIG
jgi:Na+-driven multidrug efflux pump